MRRYPLLPLLTQVFLTWTLLAPHTALAADSVIPVVYCLNETGVRTCTSAGPVGCTRDADCQGTGICAGFELEGVFGYFNPNSFSVTIDGGVDNFIVPAPAFGPGQPTTFAPGVHDQVFAARFNTADPTSNFVAWQVQGRIAMADTNTPLCLGQPEPAGAPGVVDVASCRGAVTVSPTDTAVATCDATEFVLAGGGSCGVGGTLASSNPGASLTSWDVECSEVKNGQATATAICCPL